MYVDDEEFSVVLKKIDDKTYRGTVELDNDYFMTNEEDVLVYAKSISGEDVSLKFYDDFTNEGFIVVLTIFPIMLGLALGYNSYLNIVIYFIYLFAGITRLGYFNVDDDNKKCFKGVPITTSSFVFPLILMITKSEIILMISYLMFAFLFLFNIEIKKVSFKGKIGILFLGLFLGGIILWRIL